ALPENETWQGTVELADGKIHVPFRMVLDLHAPKPIGYFVVGDERLPIPEITKQRDSVKFVFSEYGAEMSGTWNGTHLNGTYIRHRPEGTTSLKFSAAPEISKPRSRQIESANNPSPAGKYHVNFDDPNPKESATVATIWAKDSSLYGTFIAPDGDYGLLTGEA